MIIAVRKLFNIFNTRVRIFSELRIRDINLHLTGCSQ